MATTLGAWLFERDSQGQNASQDHLHQTRRWPARLSRSLQIAPLPSPPRPLHAAAAHSKPAIHPRICKSWDPSLSSKKHSVRRKVSSPPRGPIRLLTEGFQVRVLIE